MGITEFLLLKLHCASLVFVSSELKLGFGIYFLVYLKKHSSSNRFFDLLITSHDGRFNIPVMVKAKQVQTLCLLQYKVSDFLSTTSASGWFWLCLSLSSAT